MASVNVSDSYPIVDLDSDEEGGETDSSDDIDVILNGTPEQKRKLRRKSLGNISSSDDEFEKEMEAELCHTMTKLKDSALDIKSEGNKQGFYNNEYFDSDSDDEGTREEKQKKQHKIPTNDELLYDPKMDEDDELWVRKQREKYQPFPKRPHEKSKSQGPKNKIQKLPNSDAVLNCPACMSLLCLDCQRHDIYKSQYRAMFVSNCQVVSTERLRYPKGGHGKKKKGKKKNCDSEERPPLQDLEAVDDTPTLPSKCEQSNQGTSAEHTKSFDNENEFFHPVKCTICTTEVGVYDNDEVFHFFNVLASYT